MFIYICCIQLLYIIGANMFSRSFDDFQWLYKAESLLSRFCRIFFKLCVFLLMSGVHSSLCHGTTSYCILVFQDVKHITSISLTVLCIYFINKSSTSMFCVRLPMQTYWGLFSTSLLTNDKVRLYIINDGTMPKTWLVEVRSDIIGWSVARQRSGYRICMMNIRWKHCKGQ